MTHHSVVFTQKALFVIVCCDMMVRQNIDCLLGYREAVVAREAELLLYLALLELDETSFLLYDRLANEVFNLPEFLLEFLSL